jgi:outer membrane protein OmpA-like peptidoglycan-associated protein
MHDSHRPLLGALAAGLLAACSVAGPSSELVDARRAYEDANRSSAADLVPAEVLSARQALERAEAAHADDPGSERERALAYVAHRRALRAVAQGETVKAKQELAQAERRARAAQETLRLRAERELADARRELSDTARELATVRSELEQRGETLDQHTLRLREQERLLAERKAELEARTAEIGSEREARQRAETEAAAALESIAKVQEQPRGMVITLSGHLLFASGQSELLPSAGSALEAVARAVQLAEDRSVIVEGHTDARGSDEQNLRLSQARADAVRQRLVAAGVDPARIRSVGRGEGSPLADNSTPEGRAENRRVEIVLAHP